MVAALSTWMQTDFTSGPRKGFFVHFKVGCHCSKALKASRPTWPQLLPQMPCPCQLPSVSLQNDTEPEIIQSESAKGGVPQEGTGQRPGRAITVEDRSGIF